MTKKIPSLDSKTIAKDLKAQKKQIRDHNKGSQIIKQTKDLREF